MTKIRIKKTGEVKIVPEYARIQVEDCDSYGNPLEYSLDEIEIVEDVSKRLCCKPSVDWKQVEIQASIGAMQVMLTKQDLQLFVEDIAEFSAKHARALVDELKKRGEE
jgi:hypothetical protein